MDIDIHHDLAMNFSSEFLCTKFFDHSCKQHIYHFLRHLHWLKNLSKRDKTKTPHGHNFLFHLVWGSLIFIAIGGGWFYFEEQKEIADELKVELSQKNESELLKSEFEKLAFEKENLESQFLTLEKAFQELERKNASSSNQNISQKTLDLENELKSVKNELSQFKKDYESLQAESLALKSTNKQLVSASKDNTQVVGYTDGENCCFCSCKVDSLTESLNLIKVNE